MVIDPDVSRTKFDKQVSAVERQRALLAKRGCFVVNTAPPNIDVLFVARHHIDVFFPVIKVGPLGNQQLAQAGGEIPAASGAPFKVRFGFDDFDIRPPSVTFLNPWTDQPLTIAGAPGGLLEPVKGVPQLVIIDGHPDLNRPFLCVPRTREYHSHPQHTGDDWMLWRESTDVLSLIEVVWQACVNNTKTVLALAPNGSLERRWEYMGKS